MFFDIGVEYPLLSITSTFSVTVPETSIAGHLLSDEEYQSQYELGKISAGGQSFESINLVLNL